MIKRIYLSPPDITGNELHYVMHAFETNWIAPLGSNVDKFEYMVTEKTNINAALALSSGTAAMHLALMYLNVMRNDIVFCSSLTFAGSCNPIVYQEATPVFIDSEPDSWNMSPQALEKAFFKAKKNNKLPKAVIIVNIYGQNADIDTLLPLCDFYNVPIIEDAAESMGAYYKDRPSGSMGFFGVYSFNGNKIITTSGGGMLVSNDRGAIEKCRFLSTQARENTRHYEHKEIGYNYRLSNVLAGIGIGQYEQLDDKIGRRKQIYEQYKQGFSKLEAISLMPIPYWSKPNYWLTVITVDQKSEVTPDRVIDTLAEENIESRPIWKPMHLQPVFKGCDFLSHTDGISVSEGLFQQGVCLPSGSGLTNDEQDRVIQTIRSLF